MKNTSNIRAKFRLKCVFVFVFGPDNVALTSVIAIEILSATGIKA